MSSEAKGGTEGKTPAEIRKEIEGTREELGETVAAVAEKTDVKAQAQAKVEEVKAQAKAAMPESSAEAQALAKEHPKPLAIAGGVFVLFVLWRLLRR